VSVSGRVQLLPQHSSPVLQLVAEVHATLHVPQLVQVRATPASVVQSALLKQSTQKWLDVWQRLAPGQSASLAQPDTQVFTSQNVPEGQLVGVAPGRHCTQRRLVVSQTGREALQSELVVHSTHLPSVVSQVSALGHTGRAALQPATHALLVHR
jgi:hypothetical protein